MGLRITNAMKTLLGQLGIDITASTLPNLGSESDTAAASGSLFARAKFNKDAADALDLRADAIEAALLDVQTITLDTVIPTDAVTVGEITLTFVAANPGANEVLVGADDAGSATNLAAAIDALDGVSASSDGAVVTVTAGAVGLGVGIVSSDTTMTVASSVPESVIGILHALLALAAALDARVTVLEG